MPCGCLTLTPALSYDSRKSVTWSAVPVAPAFTVSDMGGDAGAAAPKVSMTYDSPGGHFFRVTVFLEDLRWTFRGSKEGLAEMKDLDWS